MNKRQRQKNNGLGPCQRSSHNSEQFQPDYEFYETGVNEVERGWIKPILAFLNHRAGGEVVALVSILALWRIASELIKEKSGLDGITLAGCLAVTIMIFVIGLLAMLRATKAKHAEDTQENQSKKTQPRVGNKCENKNGATPG